MNRKVVLITGSSKGLGKETAKKFADNNYTVVINYNNSEKQAENLAKELSNKTEVMLIKADVSNENDVKEMIDKVVEKYEKINVLINNAGIAIDNNYEDKTKEEFLKVIETNLIGTFLVTKYAAKYIEKNGNIVNISSNNAIDAFYKESMDYDASKSGIISLTHNFAKALAPIRVNAIAPGWITTDMNNELSDNQINDERNKILLKRFANPKEIAEIIYFVASDKASYLNDAVIKVDGGLK